MENGEIRELLEGLDTVWQRVNAVSECAMEVQAEMHQAHVMTSLQTEMHQPRWFCVF